MESYLGLVRRARDGDKESFARLYEGIYQELYRFALYTLRSAQDAEDAVSETVADAFASVGSLKKEEAFKAWIFRILSNKCKDKIREYARNPVALEELPERAVSSPEVTDQLYLRRLFMELSDEERLIISLHVFGGYKSREIARMLAMNANTVRTRESRALKKLAARIREQEY